MFLFGSRCCTSLSPCTAQGYLSLVGFNRSRACLRLCAPFRGFSCTYACTPSLRGGRVVLRACCWWRRRSRSPYCTLVRYGPSDPVAVCHRCRVRADSDCNTVLQVLCVPLGVAALDAAARGRGRVCNAAPPLCVASVVTRTLGVQCSAVCVALRRWRCAGVGEAAVVLSHDTSSCSCNVVVLFCMSLAAFARCLQLLCCGVSSACLHVHGIAVCRVVTCATVTVSLRCRVG
jgi:hypothetical protein